MCWRIDKVEYEKNPNCYHKVAEEDVIVYKVGKLMNGKFFPSYYSEFGYEPNSNNDKVSLKLIKKGGTCLGDHCNYIDEGYHSYSGKCELIKSFYDICVYPKFYNERCLDYYDFDDPFIGEFIIPTGTEYYENEEGEIVSSNIIWTGKIKYLININIESFTRIRLKDIDYVLDNR